MRSKKLASILNYLVMGVCSLFLVTIIISFIGKEQDLKVPDLISLLLTIVFFGTSFLNAIQFRRFIKHFYYKMEVPKIMERFLLITRISHFCICGFSLLALIPAITTFRTTNIDAGIIIAIQITIVLFFISIFLIYLYTAILQIKMIKKSKKYFWEVEAAF